jgi:hypothetical protein
VTANACFCNGQECLALVLWGKESCGDCCRPKNTIEELKRELSSLRESEAKAWGLVERIVQSEEHAWFTGDRDDFESLTTSISAARAALAARKAGA